MAEKEELREEELDAVAGGELMDSASKDGAALATIVCQSCGSTLEISRRLSPSYFHCRKCGGKMWWAPGQSF